LWENRRRYRELYSNLSARMKQERITVRIQGITKNFKEVSKKKIRSLREGRRPMMDLRRQSAPRNLNYGSVTTINIGRRSWYREERKWSVEKSRKRWGIGRGAPTESETKLQKKI